MVSNFTSVGEKVVNMKASKHGYIYCEMEDMKEICGKCRFSYNGDWSIQDCSYCPLPRIVQLTQKQAEQLERQENELDTIAEGTIYE